MDLGATGPLEVARWATGLFRWLPGGGCSGVSGGAGAVGGFPRCRRRPRRPPWRGRTRGAHPIRPTLTSDAGQRWLPG